MTVYLLVNFGGPRDLSEIPSFLNALFLDRDVIRTKWPDWIHDWIFRRVAQKRASVVVRDYQKIGGKSPIYFDTETIKEELARHLQSPVFSFHRYLPATHPKSIEAIEQCESEEIKVISLFPQFCYATTGSIARFFEERLSSKTLKKLRWIRSYADHAAFTAVWKQNLSRFLKKNSLLEEETVLLFSAHGTPRLFIEEGDPYEKECRRSYREVLRAFPNALGRLSYQSKFGRGGWPRPYTGETCAEILSWHEGRGHVVIVPITFTSDHIETLFEIEELYLPLIRAKKLNAYRCPALNCDPLWIASLARIAQGAATSPNS